MKISIALGVLVFLVGVALLGSIAVNLHTHRLLKRCLDMLDFVYGMILREEQKQAQSMADEGAYSNEGTD